MQYNYYLSNILESLAVQFIKKPLNVINQALGDTGKCIKPL